MHLHSSNLRRGLSCLFLAVCRNLNNKWKSPLKDSWSRSGECVSVCLQNISISYKRLSIETFGGLDLLQGPIRQILMAITLRILGSWSRNFLKNFGFFDEILRMIRGFWIRIRIQEFFKIFFSWSFFFELVGRVRRYNRLDYGGDPDHYLDPEFFKMIIYLLLRFL